MLRKSAAGLGEAYTESCFGRVCPFMLTGMMSSVSRVCVQYVDPTKGVAA